MTIYNKTLAGFRFAFVGGLCVPLLRRVSKSSTEEPI